MDSWYIYDNGRRNFEAFILTPSKYQACRVNSYLPLSAQSGVLKHSVDVGTFLLLMKYAVLQESKHLLLPDQKKYLINNMQIDASDLDLKDETWVLEYNAYHKLVATPNFTPVDTSSLKAQAKPTYYPTADGVLCYPGNYVHINSTITVVPAQPTKPVYARADPSRDGCRCRKCGTFYDYAEADGPDGHLLCCGCQQLISVFS